MSGSVRCTTTRRGLLRAGAACTAALWVGQGRAQSVDVPVRLQAEPLAKVVAYDRNFAARARGHALVLILVKSGYTESQRLGEQIRAELGVLEELGGLPHTEELVRFTTRRALAELCQRRGAAVLYVSVGFAAEMPGIAGALSEQSILSVSAVPAYVARGSVLGFDAASGRPKLVVNLTQARAQKVAFKPELLKLARVIP